MGLLVAMHHSKPIGFGVGLLGYHPPCARSYSVARDARLPIMQAAHLFLVVLRSLLWAKLSLATADYAHFRAVSALIRCPTTFFEAT